VEKQEVDMKGSFKQIAVSYLWITAASLLYAVGFCWCYQPTGIAFGGITGVAQIIHAVVPVAPIGVLVILLNVPLFLLGWKFIGGKLLVSSLYAMAVSSVFIDIVNAWHTFEPLEPILAALFGGLLLGLSLGVIFLCGATTGGTDLVARLLKLKLNWLPMGKLLLVADLVVIVSVAAVFRDLSAALYGLVALAVSSYVMDEVLYGMDNAKVAYIISDYPEEIIKGIDQELDRGVTILHGEGAYTGDQKRVLLCAFKQRQIVSLKRTVKECDPSAFLIVCEAHEVLGDGFRDYKKDDL
jgi:uncharacterized membrane-anchored protein YitT (DUF2179 family)